MFGALACAIITVVAYVTAFANPAFWPAMWFVIFPALLGNIAFVLRAMRIKRTLANLDA
ncbi:MAG: hypothetical protein AABY18_08585 [Candidatus Thermoplasmatota archaeon]